MSSSWTTVGKNAAEIPPVSESCIRIAMVGDIVGKPGMRIACAAPDWLRKEAGADAVIANAENAADGSGLRCKDYRRLVDHGVDAITLGDHAFRKREIMEILDSQSNIVRPANWPADAPGKSYTQIEVAAVSVGITCALGRVFMGPVDCPFTAMDRVCERFTEADVHVRLVDFHAEATSDMQVMARYLDGRVSAVLGTHTHVATADERVLPGGTGFQSDVGMTGPFESILGRKIAPVTEATIKFTPVPFQVATGDVRMNCTWFDADKATGVCKAIGRIDLPEALIADYSLPRPALGKR